MFENARLKFATRSDNKWPLSNLTHRGNRLRRDLWLTSVLDTAPKHLVFVLLLFFSSVVSSISSSNIYVVSSNDDDDDDDDPSQFMDTSLSTTGAQSTYKHVRSSGQPTDGTEQRGKILGTWIFSKCSRSWSRLVLRFCNTLGNDRDDMTPYGRSTAAVAVTPGNDDIRFNLNQNQRLWTEVKPRASVVGSPQQLNVVASTL